MEQQISWPESFFYDGASQSYECNCCDAVANCTIVIPEPCPDLPQVRVTFTTHVKTIKS